MSDNRTPFCPVSEKYLLTVREASAYFGIGEKRIRFIAQTNPSLSLMNGGRCMIRKKDFERFIDETSGI